MQKVMGQGNQAVDDIQAAFQSPGGSPADLGNDASPVDPMQHIMDQMDAESAQRSADMAESRRQSELVAQLRTEFLWAKQERERYMDKLWNECYKMYRGGIPDERMSGEWRSKLNVPTIWNTVEGAVPHLMEGIWANDEPFRLKLGSEDKLIDAHTKLLRYELDELMDAEGQWELHQRQKALYGTSAWYTGFRTDYEDRSYWRVEPNPDPNVSPQMVLDKEKVPIYVGTTGEVVDIYNIYPHPRATSSKMPYLFVVQYLSRAQMEAMKRFKNLDKLTDGMTVSAPNMDTLIAERREKPGSANSTTSTVAERLYPIITKYDEEKRMVISFNYYSDIIMEEMPYPFFHNRCPIVFDRVSTMQFEFWGVGFAEPVLPLAHELNSIRNQRRDNENLTTNAMLEVRSGEIEDEEDELVMRPGAIAHSMSGNAIRFVQPPALNDSYQAEQTVKNDIDRTTGLSGPIMGEAADGVSSASGNSMLQRAQLLRLRRAIKNECRCFKEVISQMLALNEQFLPLPEVFEVLGPLHFGDYQLSDLKAIAGRTVVQVVPAGIYDDENILRQQNTNLLNVLGANPLFAQEIDWQYMLRQTLRLNGIADPAIALKKPKGLDVMQAMFAAEENTMMAQGQPVPPAQPTDDYDMHMEMHNTLLQMNPTAFQLVGQHMVSHDIVKAQGIQQQAALQTGAAGGPAPGPGINGPGSAPPGAGGGVNHNRQPQPTGQLGIQRSQARLSPGAK